MMGPMRPGSGGDLPLAFFAVLAALFLVALAVLAVMAWQQKRRERQASRHLLDRARAAVRQQIDAAADDILRLEDTVRLADKPEALAHYRKATIAYSAIVAEYEIHQHAPELIDLATRLDSAIWHLDAAEAILDEYPIPPNPAGHRVEPKAQPTQRSVRRPERRSTVGVHDLISTLLDPRRKPNGPSDGDQHRHRRHC